MTAARLAQTAGLARQRRPGGGRPSRWWAGACAGREEIASVLVVVEKTPAHCVSVTWSTLGRQPRARGDTHIWNTDAVSLILAAPRSLFIPCVRLRRCDVARAAISGRRTARGKRIAANNAGSNHGCNSLEQPLCVPALTRSARPSIALTAQLLDQGIELVLNDPDGAGADLHEAQPAGHAENSRRPPSSGFVKTFKRDYVRVNPLSDAITALRQIAGWFLDYNENHPHSGLKMRSPREFMRAQSQ